MSMLNRKSLNASNIIFWLIVLLSSSYTSVVFADTPDAASMLEHLALTIPHLMRLVTAIAYVMGMFFVFKGIMELKQFGESRTMMTRNHSIAGPLLYFVAGTCLLYLPSAAMASLSSFWDHPNPYAYPIATGDAWSTLIRDVFLVVALVGTISFIRGVAMLTNLGNGSQQGIFARSITHMISGIFCINLYQFIDTINTTLGLTQFS